jgi:dipeptidyl aminopeptidase/acylaminoacyl peptidase
MWRCALAGLLVVASAVAASTAHPARRAVSAFPRCYDLVGGGQPSTAPDGTLVYAYGYYVHSVRSDGTHDRTLFAADAPVSSPSVSPDGRLIAFGQGTPSPEIWVMNRDGSDSHYVASGTTPAFAPDGAHLAIGGAPTGANRGALDVIGIDGTGRRTLAVDALPSPEPAWSPDGTKILFNSYVIGMYTGPMVKLIDADGTNERDFVAGGSANWSPDGTAVAYTFTNFEAGTDVAIIDADRTVPTSRR